MSDILQGDFLTMGVTTGINSLSPSAPVYSALEGAPFAPGLKFDSIIVTVEKAAGSIARMELSGIGVLTSTALNQN